MSNKDDKKKFWRFEHARERYQLSILNGMDDVSAQKKAEDELTSAGLADKISDFRRRGPRSDTHFFSPGSPPSSFLPKFQLEKKISQDDLQIFDTNYSSFRHNILQCSLPTEVFKKVRAKYGNCIFEAFASPINVSEHSEQWASMFESDKAFGSLGPFQSVPSECFHEKVVILHPPFIEYFMETILLPRIQELVGNAKQVLFCLPNWTDTKWYKMLDQILYSTVLQSDQYSYIRGTNHTSIVAHFQTVLFSTCPELIQITKESMKLNTDTENSTEHKNKWHNQHQQFPSTKKTSRTNNTQQHSSMIRKTSTPQNTEKITHTTRVCKSTSGPSTSSNLWEVLSEE